MQQHRIKLNFNNKTKKNDQVRFVGECVAEFVHGILGKRGWMMESLRKFRTPTLSAML